MNGILVSNYNESGENVMIFRKEDSSIEVKHIENMLKSKGHICDDIVEVQPNDFQFYLYEPLYLQPEQEYNLIRTYLEAQFKTMA